MGDERARPREREMFPIHWLIPQMPLLGQAQGRSWELDSGFRHGSRNPIIGAIPTASQMLEAEKSWDSNSDSHLTDILTVKLNAHVLHS